MHDHAVFGKLNIFKLPTGIYSEREIYIHLHNVEINAKCKIGLSRELSRERDFFTVRKISYSEFQLASDKFFLSWNNLSGKIHHSI